MSTADDFATLRRYIEEARRISVDAEFEAMVALARIEAENERLRTERDGLKAQNDLYAANAHQEFRALIEARAEVERLKTRLFTEHEGLKLEVDRLRAAIQDALNPNLLTAPHLVRSILRAALGDE
jgi:hypothetical protein